MTDGDELEGEVKGLKVKSIIGFDGSTVKGFIVHPDKKHVVYPLGNKVTIQEWYTKEQYFLSGHTNIISAIDISRSGKYIVSGQINHIGFKARVIIWDFEKRTQISEYELHKVRVEAVVFSKDDKYAISLGGRDCGSVIVWDLEQKQLLCGAHASRGVQGEATVILPMNRRGACFLTAGDHHLSMWKINRDARKLVNVDVSCLKLKRAVLCMDANERDEFCYCGTTTGDVLKVRLNYHHDADILDPVKQPVVVGCFARLTRKKLPRGSVDLYEQGVRSIKRLFSGLLIIGAGNGTLELAEETGGKITDFSVKLPSIPALKIIKTTKVHSGISSIQLIDNETQILAATTNCEIFSIDIKTFETRLLVTCHTSTIYDVAFPHKFSEVFATAGKHDVRVWSMTTMQELLRIKVQNFSCSSVLFSHDGKSILTAWNDGIIRSFTPLTGRLIYAILNAHNKGVSALETTSHGRMLVSGGCEGQVRLWSVSPYRQELICTLKEHKGPVSAIHVNQTDTEAVSASTDGTCIIWDLERQYRRQILFANTLFMCVKFFPTGVQILTAGSDRKVSYWEVLDGSLVRELEGSPTGTVNTLDISPGGEYFVTGGDDQIVKLWRYQEGITTHIGLGHAAVITSARFSPNGEYIVTASATGSVFIWECPKVVDNLDIPEEPAEERKVTPASSGRKEENIKDLPSSRSSISSSGDAKKCSCVNIQTCCCHCPCPVKASEKSCSSPVDVCSPKSHKSTGNPLVCLNQSLSNKPMKSIKVANSVTSNSSKASKH